MSASKLPKAHNTMHRTRKAVHTMTSTEGPRPLRNLAQDTPATATPESWQGDFYRETTSFLGFLSFLSFSFRCLYPCRLHRGVNRRYGTQLTKPATRDRNACSQKYKKGQWPRRKSYTKANEFAPRFLPSQCWYKYVPWDLRPKSHVTLRFTLHIFGLHRGCIMLHRIKGRVPARSFV